MVGGLAWLAIMLQAYEAEGTGLSAFPRVYLIALAQAYLIQDPVKVLFITFISPPFWARIFTPGTKGFKRAEVVRGMLRMPLGFLLT